MYIHTFSIFMLKCKETQIGIYTSHMGPMGRWVLNFDMFFGVDEAPSI